MAIKFNILNVSFVLFIDEEKFIFWRKYVFFAQFLFHNKNIELPKNEIQTPQDSEESCVELNKNNTIITARAP